MARFLLDKKMQAAARGGRVVIDETSMLGHKDAVRLFQIAEADDLKLIFVGDPMQHGSVPRGAFMRLLKDYGGVQPFRLTRDHAAGRPGLPGGGAVALRGQDARGLRRPRPPGLGQGDRRRAERYAAIAADYLQALNEKKSVAGGQPDARGSGASSPRRSAASSARRASSAPRSGNSPGWCRSNATEAERGRPERTGRATCCCSTRTPRASPKASASPSPIRRAVPLAEAAKFSRLPAGENLAGRRRRHPLHRHGEDAWTATTS